MSASLFKSCHFLTVSCFLSTCDCMSIEQQCHMVVSLSMLLRHFSCFLTISYCFITKVLSLRYFSYSVSQDCTIFVNAPSLICEHYHHHHWLYRTGWVLASSSKCHQRPLPWADANQFLQPSFLASSSNSSTHLDFSQPPSRVCP